MTEQEKQKPKIIGKSKGGSDLIQYSDQEVKPEMGFLPESNLKHLEDREKAFVEFFGESDVVSHESLPMIPHIDVYRHPPNEARSFYTYVTGGMSDLPMASPEQLGNEFRRAEIVFYSETESDDYFELLRFLARFVHDNQTWLHWDHTIPNGQPPEPLFGSQTLDTFFFMPSIVEPDNEFAERLQIDGDPVHLLWLVPITTAECELKLESGSEALYELFEQNQHPFVFSGDRDSYV